MYRSLAALLAGLVLSGPVLSDCADPGTFGSLGRITTKGGGTYEYGLIIGGEGGMRGFLTGGPNGLTDERFDLDTPYHIDVAGAGLARLLAPEASAAEAKGTRLSVGFAPKGRLPKAEPGKSWSGTFEASVFATGKDDYNRRSIGEAKLKGSYTFLDEISAKFDGCAQRIIPVELLLTYNGETALKRRILYFPDLGVSAITGWGPDADGPARKTGITGIGIAD